MVRVRYLKDSNGNLVSKENMLAGNIVVNVLIDPKRFSWSVSNRENGDILLQGTEVSLVMAKLKAKATLKSIGVLFDDEIRQREPIAVEGMDI